jgi:hypothetical protein
MPGGALVTRDTLAEMFGTPGTNHESKLAKVRRALQDGELPRPVMVCGLERWTADSILDHTRQRLEQANATPKGGK